MRKKRLKKTDGKHYALVKAAVIMAIYFLLGTLWIIGSEIVVMLHKGESQEVFFISITKGILFIAATALIFFFLFYRQILKILKESETRAKSEVALKEAQMAAKICSFEFDASIDKMYPSTEALQIFGVQDQIKDDNLKSYLELVHPLDIERVQSEIHEAIRSRKETTMLFQAIMPEGDVRVLQVHLNGGYGENQTNRISGTIQDVTDLIQAENAAKDNEAIFKAFINSSCDLIYLKDSELKYIAVNTNMLRFYGMNAEELIGKHTSEAFSEPGAVEWESRDRSVIETGKMLEVEDEGKGRTFETIIFPVEMANHKRGVGGIARDISRRKQAEEDVLRERDRAQTYFEIAAIINVAMDKGGVVLQINRAGCEKLGLKKEQIIGKKWVDQFVPENEKEKVRSEIQKILSGASNLESSHENSILTSDGTIRRIEWRNALLRDADGAVIGFFSAGVDVTELYTTIQALKESERSKSVMISNLPGMAYRRAYDRTWTMIFASNGCYGLMGYYPEELIANRRISFNEIICPEYREQVWNENVASLEKHESIRSEYEIRSATGERKWVLDISQGVYSSSGEVLALEGIIVDITSSKRQFLQILYLNDHDQLTGIYNRSYFEAERNRLDREMVSPVSVLLSDINGLKLINDAFGTQTGDRIIQRTARLLEESMRPRETLARIGGDEFAMLMPEMDESTAVERIHEIRNALNVYNNSQPDKTLVISLSIDMAVKKSNENDLLQTEKEAEANLSRQKLFDQKSHHNAVLSSIMATMFERSYETEEHAERIGSLCTVVGERMGLTHAEIDRLKLFAYLHDIGKVGVSDRILNKPGPLDAEELVQMRKHPEIGYRIAMSSPDLALIAELILSHHERWDGKGYPNNLAGEDIPLLSRILAVADAYDAMTQDRVYRKAMPKKAALKEIRNNIGTQFDPAIANIFLEILRKNDL